MMQYFNLNHVELVVFITIIVIQLCHLIIRRIPSGELILILLCCVPAAYFASAGCVRFLSWDESYIFYDIINFRTSPLLQWSFGALRTSTTLWGPLFSVIQSLTHISKDITLVLVKASHLITGVLLITIMIDQLHSCFFQKFPKTVFHAVMFNAVMFLPVTGIALKTLNYDLLSMLSGTLGTLLCIGGISKQSKWRIFFSIIILTLAANEKLIASPFLWAGMVASVSALSWQHKKSAATVLLSRLAMWSAAVPAVSLIVIVLSFIYVKAFHDLSVPLFTAQQMLIAYSSCFWPFWNLFHIGSSFFTITLRSSLLTEIGIVLKGILIIVCIVFASSAAFIAFLKIIISRKLYTAIPRVNFIVSKCNFSILTIITITGIIAGYTLNVKIWPLIPISEGYYVPQATFNNIALQFGAKTVFGHSFFSAAWACAVYINALPTTLLLLMVLGTVITIRSQERYSVHTDTLLLNLFTMFCLCAPVVYGVLQLPLYSRYFNLFLLGPTLSLIPIFIKWYHTRPKQLTIICIAGSVFMFIESYPFQSFVASFRPVWSNCSSSINQQPSIGNVTPWYPGWGEELPDAFERIIKEFPCDTQEIRLYYNFPAALIGPPINVLTSAMPKGHGTLPYRYSGHDFYILSRNGVSTYTYIPFPSGIKPVFTIKNRGFVKAWVFRGSDLYNNGFSF